MAQKTSTKIVVAPVAPVAVAQPEIALYDANGNVIGKMTLFAKNFQTGSRGFYNSAKVEIGGKRYQGNFQLVEIGSKPNTLTK